MRFSRIWRRAGNARHFDEEGFTLIEMIISIAILAIVVSAIALALITVLILSGHARKSISSSADAQVVSANLTNDVRSAAEVTTSPTTPTGNRHWCGSGTRLLGLEWDQVSGKATTFDTVVSYLAVTRGSTRTTTTGPKFEPTWVLVREQCTATASGYSSAPSSRSTIASHICPPKQTLPAETGCTPTHTPTHERVTQQPPTISSRTPKSIPTRTPTKTPTLIENGLAAKGWTSAVTVGGVSFKITEPTGYYSHALVVDPSAASTSNGTTESPVTPTPSCGYATPETGPHSGQLCFVNFNKYTFEKAAYTKPTSCGDPITEGISDTPFSLSLCLKVQAGTEQTGDAPPSGWSSVCNSRTHRPAGTGSGVPKPPHPPVTPFTGTKLCSDPSSADVVAVPFPTYTAAPTSEAFLGNNGFYTGVPGDPALYTYLEGTDITLYFTTIKVIAPDKTLASNWSLVTGDAESTDTDESITWSTCSATTGATGGGLEITGQCTSPKFSLIPNNSSQPNVDYYGNACMNKTYTNVPPNGLLRYGGLDVYTATAGKWTPHGTAFPLTSNGPAVAQEVECAADVSSDKTGTVMLEAPKPANLTHLTLTVNMVGTGLQAIFLGILL